MNGGVCDVFMASKVIRRDQYLCFLLSSWEMGWFFLRFPVVRIGVSQARKVEGKEQKSLASRF